MHPIHLKIVLTLICANRKMLITCRRWGGINNREDIENAKRRAIRTYLRRVLQPMHVSCFFANFIMPPVEGVDMEIDLV
jgi:hypothetical protein